MTRAPEVSVVVPTRDRWGLLSAHALPSAFAQEDVELEVLVVDDRSSDGTPDRLAGVADPRLRVFSNERTPGVSGARNTGIDAAAGRWLAFLDDDDLWSPRRLRTQLDAMGGARWGYASVVVVDESLTALHLHRPPPPSEIASALALGNVVGGPSNVVAETRLVRELGGFDERLRHGEDWDLWLRLARAAEPGDCSEVIVGAVWHRQRTLFRDRSDVAAETRRVFEKHGGASRRQLLAVEEWLAHEHRAAGNHLRAAAIYGRAGVRYRSPGNLLGAMGALFGESGLRAVSRLLRSTRGATHLEPYCPPATEPEWLAEARSRLLVHA